MERLQALQNQLEDNQRLNPEPTASLQEQYDFIIVGGGTAGCVLASRLSEDPRVSVLLIEAGGEPSIRVHTPGLYGVLQLTDVDWMFKTEKQPHLNGRVQNWPRGKVFGGCSSINAMLYVRGDKENYNTWERNGCLGWGFKDVLPYFKKIENFKRSSANPEYRGKDGPLLVTQSSDNNPYTPLVIDALKDNGFQFNPDYNGETIHGISYSQFNISDNTRQSTYKAYLFEQKKVRKNLTIIGNTYVTRVLFQGNTAIGVEFKSGSINLDVLKKKKSQVVFASKEVILCGGAINTPWLLMLSGVGPKEELQSKGIPVVNDLPVGRNLQDHLFVFHSFETLDGEGFCFRKDWRISKYILKYLFLGTGPLTKSLLEATAFKKTGLRTDTNEADLQIHFVPAGPTDDTSLQSNHEDPFWKNANKNFPRHAISLLPTLLLPKSVGIITLSSRDPFSYPKIQPNSLSDHEGYDLQVLVEGMKINRKAAQHPKLKHLLKEVIDTTIPHSPESDEYLKEFVRKSANTVYHPVGTCKMGPEGDSSAVVDLALKVKGINNLRVVDASIMPSIVSANTHVPVIMIAEKASDLIKAQYQLK